MVINYGGWEIATALLVSTPFRRERLRAIFTICIGVDERFENDPSDPDGPKHYKWFSMF